MMMFLPNAKNRQVTTALLGSGRAVGACQKNQSISIKLFISFLAETRGNNGETFFGSVISPRPTEPIIITFRRIGRKFKPLHHIVLGPSQLDQVHLLVTNVTHKGGVSHGLLGNYPMRGGFWSQTRFILHMSNPNPNLRGRNLPKRLHYYLSLLC